MHILNLIKSNQIISAIVVVIIVLAVAYFHSQKNQNLETPQTWALCCNNAVGIIIEGSKAGPYGQNSVDGKHYSNGSSQSLVSNIKNPNDVFITILNEEDDETVGEPFTVNTGVVVNKGKHEFWWCDNGKNATCPRPPTSDSN